MCFGLFLQLSCNIIANESHQARKDMPPVRGHDSEILWAKLGNVICDAKWCEMYRNVMWPTKGYRNQQSKQGPFDQHPRACKVRGGWETLSRLCYPKCYWFGHGQRPGGELSLRSIVTSTCMCCSNKEKLWEIWNTCWATSPAAVIGNHK